MREAARSVVEIDLTEITSGRQNHSDAGCRQPIAAFAALLAMPTDVTLPVKSDGKDRATGMRDDRWNDEARCEPVRRLGRAAHGADCIGAIQLSKPAGENPGRLHTRHGPGPCGAHSSRPVFGSMGHA